MSTTGAPLPVTDLSDSSEQEPIVVPPKGSKRKRPRGLKTKKPRFALTDELGIQLLLSRKCSAKCTRRCKEAFLAKQSYQEFQAFRKEFSEFHKTDQDTIETQILHRRFWRYFLGGSSSNRLFFFIGFSCLPHMLLFVLKVFQRIRALIEERDRLEKLRIDWNFLGRSVCQRSFQELHGIGA